MMLAFRCPCCAETFEAPAPAATLEALERMADVGPWAAAGDGETIEDEVYSALGMESQVRCPFCGTPSAVSEESLGEFANELLAQW
jgi:hypothetical protein